MPSFQSRLNRPGIFFKLLLSFSLFALIMASAMGVTAYFSAQSLSMEFLASRTDLLLGAVLQAEEHARSGSENPMDANGLIEQLNLKFLAGKEVAAKMDKLPDGIHFLHGGEDYIFIRHIDGIPYVITGSAARKEHILKDIAVMFVLCALAGLVTAAILAFFMSRFLARPTQLLANAIDSAGPEKCTSIPPKLLERNDETGLLARTLNQYQKRMTDYMEMEKSFTGAASHELRTPLTVISQGLEILEAQTDLQDKSQKVISRLLATSDQMNRTVADLLALARGEMLPIKMIDPKTELLAALEILNPELYRQSTTANLQDEITIPFDSIAHIQIKGQTGMIPGKKELAFSIFRNLLENAIRHRDNSDILVTITQEEIRICNKGEFDQEKTGNSGFGLQIARRACERMGWELRRIDAFDETIYVVRFKPDKSER